MSVGQWAVDISCPISSWHQLDNQQLTSFGQWAADISWPMCSRCQLANTQLLSVGQWAVDISCPVSSWLMSSWQCYRAAVLWFWSAMVLQLHGSTVFTWCFSDIIQYGYRQTDRARVVLIVRRSYWITAVYTADNCWVVLHIFKHKGS